MTCREFLEAAELLTPMELRLMEAKNELMSLHANECAGCSKWMESQRWLGGGLQILRAQTAQREPRPEVEQAVLEAFRAGGFDSVAAVAPDRAAPAVWKLSRFFEVGAYVAVAAALIVGVFLGGRMWRDRQAPPTQVQMQAATPAEVGVARATTVAGNGKTSGNVVTVPERTSEDRATMRTSVSSVKRTAVSAGQSEMANIDKQGFVPLMFCDPLICSGEEQVIRMELPGTAAGSADGNTSQPVIADVVVGDDGLVRAMRIVN